jgi:hypothetical protein
MAPFQPKRALVVGTIVVAPLTLLAGVLFAINEETAVAGFYVLMAMPCATAFVTAWFLHAVDAILLTTFLAALGVLLIGALVIGFESLVMMHHLAVWMFAATAIGAILGLLVRPWIRARFDL